MNLGARIRAERQLRGWSQQQLSEKAGLPAGKGQQAINGLESRNANVSKYAGQLADALDLNLNWALTGTGPKYVEGREPGGIKIAALAAGSEAAPSEFAASEMAYVRKVSGAHLSAGHGEIAWDFEEIADSHAFRRDWLVSEGLKAERCAVWTVRGDSMELRYPAGSWVLINMAQREPVHGKNFALIGEDGLKLKQLRKTENGWSMYSLNLDQNRFPPEPIVDDNYAIIGRVRSYGGGES